MNIGDIVKVKAIGQHPRDMMYAGWIGKIVNIDACSQCLVDSDGPGVLQAVSFKRWFPKYTSLDLVIAAWGAFQFARTRAEEVRKMVPQAKCLGVTKDGHPRHPLYLSKNLRPMEFPHAD